MKYSCDLCDYNTSSKKDYSKHLTTQKHMKADKILMSNPEKSHLELNIKLFECTCGNVYKHSQSLHKHKASCCKLYGNNNQKNEEKPNNVCNSGFVIDKEIVMSMLLKNQEMMKKVM